MGRFGTGAIWSPPLAACLPKMDADGAQDSSEEGTTPAVQVRVLVTPPKSEMTSACIKCWSLGRIVFAFEVGLVGFRIDFCFL